MSGFSNSELLKHVFSTLYNIVSRRTSSSYSAMILTDIINTLEDKFIFLRYIKVKESIYTDDKDDIIEIFLDIDSINQQEIAKAIESIIRVTGMNIKNGKAGLYLINELKSQLDYRYISQIKKHGIDLDLIQLEQHYYYKQKKSKKPFKNPSQENKSKNMDKKYISLLNYTWDNVAFWEYNDNICTIYNKKGEVLDKLPLDKIIKDYMMEMTGFDQVPENSKKLVELNEKEYDFLQMLFSRDMDTETARHLLHVSRKELGIIIRKLLVYEVLQYVSYDEIELTDNAITLLTDKQKRIKN